MTGIRERRAVHVPARSAAYAQPTKRSPSFFVIAAAAKKTVAYAIWGNASPSSIQTTAETSPSETKKAPQGSDVRDGDSQELEMHEPFIWVVEGPKREGFERRQEQRVIEVRRVVRGAFEDRTSRAPGEIELLGLQRPDRPPVPLEQRPKGE